jgi:hypothetical protein
MAADNSGLMLNVDSAGLEVLPHNGMEHASPNGHAYVNPQPNPHEQKKPKSSLVCGLSLKILSIVLAAFAIGAALGGGLGGGLAAEHYR